MRQKHIHNQLDLADRTEVHLRKRIRRHDALMAHMRSAYSTACKKWNLVSRLQEGRNETSVKASMETKESRDAFVRQGLALERAAMHIKGVSEDTAIELD